MKHKKEIYEKMKRRDFGESMCDETKLKVLNFIERQLRLYNVSQQRELLIAFDNMREFDIKHDDIGESVDYFLKNKESYL